jgi:phage baseplate assembly protein W
MFTLVEKDIVNSVKQNIRLIILTPKGSDIHRPEFGSDTWQYVDQPLTALTVGKIKAEVVEAIETWEPRVKVKAVSVEKDGVNARMKIGIIAEIPELEEEIEVPVWM